MRDVLIHDYIGVDLEGVWNVASHRIPELQRIPKPRRRSEISSDAPRENPRPGVVPFDPYRTASVDWSFA